MTKMATAYIEVEMPKMQPIVDSLWALAQAKPGVRDVDRKYVQGIWRLQTKTDTTESYIYKRKEYTQSEWIDFLGASALMPGKRKYQRKITLRAALGVVNPINEQMVEELAMEVEFFINQTTNTDCMIGAKLWSWDECGSHITVYHQPDAEINSTGFKRCQALICQIGKDLAVAHKSDIEEINKSMKGVMV